jgi:hypothetical protein
VRTLQARPVRCKSTTCFGALCGGGEGDPANHEHSRSPAGVLVHTTGHDQLVGRNDRPPPTNITKSGRRYRTCFSCCRNVGRELQTRSEGRPFNSFLMRLRTCSSISSATRQRETGVELNEERTGEGSRTEPDRGRQGRTVR